MYTPVEPQLVDFLTDELQKELYEYQQGLEQYSEVMAEYSAGIRSDMPAIYPAKSDELKIAESAYFSALNKWSWEVDENVPATDAMEIPF